MTEDCAGTLASTNTAGGGGVAVGVDATEALLAFALKEPTMAPNILLFVREDEPLLWKFGGRAAVLILSLAEKGWLKMVSALVRVEKSLEKVIG